MRKLRYAKFLRFFFYHRSCILHSNCTFLLFSKIESKKKKKIKRGLVVKKIDFEKDILIIHYPLEDLEERCLL